MTIIPPADATANPDSVRRGCARCTAPATHVVKNYWVGNRAGLEKYGPDLPVCENHATSTMTNLNDPAGRSVEQIDSSEKA